jgi:ATP-binding cassette, subfamily C, bacterial
VIRKNLSRAKSRWVNSAFGMYMRMLLSVIGSWKVGMALVLMLCVSVTQGAQLLLLVPLMQLVGLDVQQGSMSWLADFVSSALAIVGMRPTLVTVLSAFVLLSTVLALVRRYQLIFNYQLQENFASSLRRRLYRAIANTDWLTFSRSRSSDFTHALATEIGRIGAATAIFLHLITSILLSALYVLFAFQLSEMLTTLVFVSGAGLLVVLRKKIQAARQTGEDVSLATNGLYAAAIEHLAGMKVTRSYGAEERSANVFERVAKRVEQMNLNMVRNQAETGFWFNTGSIVILCVLLYAAFEVLGMSAAELLLLLFLFNRIIPLFSGIQRDYQQCLNVLPAFIGVTELLARCEAATELRPASLPTPLESIELREAIRFEMVSFAYDKESAAAIQELNLTIRAGETTAIVGPSGAGKSTIADLAMGLITPSCGRVLVNETPLDGGHMQSWRSHIGYVAQDTFLFNDTVKANLLWARPGATETEIVQALKLAAGEFVFELPQGVETVLGDRGVRLSGGERQRLALARALLRKPSLLILDEATSALDSENERRIQDAIERLHGRMTILVITHRLSTIRGADVIHVLERGRLVESGHWDTLLGEPEGRFASLCSAQGIGRRDELASLEASSPPGRRLEKESGPTEERRPSPDLSYTRRS